jgi:hypothetical protein
MENAKLLQTYSPKIATKSSTYLLPHKLEELRKSGKVSLARLGVKEQAVMGEFRRSREILTPKAVSAV